MNCVSKSAMQDALAYARARIMEIFCSVQGEGPYVGVRQAFVRFAGCNLNCIYCDTQTKITPKCRAEKTPGMRDFEELDNPFTPEKVADIIQRYNDMHSVSLTGGEPLLYADFIRNLKVDLPLYLETNMTLPEEAKKIKDRVRYVAGDFKLKSALDSNYDEIYERTLESFKILRKKKSRDCFCKVVVLKYDKEIIEGVEQVKEYISCVILQPVTPFGKVRERPSVAEMLELQEKVSHHVEDVRIIPQTHKIWEAL